MGDVLSRLRSALAGRYTLERELGHGGMATVWLARDLKHDRSVALKVLRPEVAAALGPERFLREITVTAGLHHPHILPLLDSGEAAGQLFYVMPYVAGESLRDRLNRERQLPIEDAVQITRDVADALSHAHSHDVVHRDIKPENILLESGHAVVADFGIAKALTAAGGDRLTETGIAVGTPAYMSPEQAAGSQELDGRSDLYSLGCVLYEMLSGETPYTGPTPQAILAKKLSGPLPRISVVRETVPGQVEAALNKALARVPADRFAVAGQLSSALAIAPAVYRRREQLVRKLRRALVLGAAVALLTMGIFGVLRYRTANSWKRVPLDPSAVAIMPFRVTAVDPAFAALGEGVIDLLYPILSGGDGPRAIEPNPFLLALREQRNLGDDASLRLAARFRAAHLLEGSVTQTGAQLTLNGWLRSVPSGDLVARHSVSGSPDSIHVLVYRLAIGLIGTEVGESAERVATFSGRPPQAIAAYLAGARAYREGRFVAAAQSFERALSSDSTFALAALRLYQAAVLGSPTRYLVPALRAAKAARATLGRREQAALDAELVSRGIDTTGTWVEELKAVRAWLSAAPDEPEGWIRYAMVLRYAGSLLSVEDWARQARDAQERAWRLDSTTPGLVDQHLSSSVETDDFEWVQRVGTRYLEVADSTVDGWRGSLWLIALLRGDSTTIRTLRRQWQRSETATEMPWVPWYLARASWALGLSLGEADSAVERIRRHLFTPGDSQAVAWYLIMTGLSRGRVRQVSDVQLGPVGRFWSGRVGMWQLLLTWWLGHPGFDSAAAIAADSLRAVVATNPDAFRAECYVELYRAARGDTLGARQAARRLLPRFRKERLLGVCPAMVEAFVESHDLTRTDTPALDYLEAVLRQGPMSEFPFNVGIPVLVRLRRQRGQLEAALAAARVHILGNFYSQFQTTLLKEEGDLAALTGDTSSAIIAYQKYLRLMTDPDPGPAAEEVQGVRGALGRLRRGRG